MKGENLELIKTKFLQEFEGAKTSKERRKICKKYLEDELSSVFASLKKLSGKEKAELGKEANNLKELFSSKMTMLKEIKKEKDEWIDVTLPGKKPALGSIHPLTRTQRRCAEILSHMGFVTVEGPELESEWYNFDALNVEQDHPAREMQDTLFIKQKNREKLSPRERLLMRTQTSAVQARYMEKNKPPLKIIVLERVFRNEATDSSHEINFYQLEGLMVEEKLSVANLQAVTKLFFHNFFGSDVDIRFRPSYFPFTEPSFEVDVSCTICKKRGCSACQRTGWLEIMGAGMVHPNVLESAGIDPSQFTGFAFGMGVDRLAMIKYEIDDIRLFYGSDLRFLNQF